jgi:hypothetical protein
MKFFIICVLCILAVGCGQFDRATATITGNSESCVDGVTYLQFTSGACVKVDINGKPVGCK